MSPMIQIPSDTPDTEPLAPLAPEQVTLELQAADQEVSKSGNDMIVLKFGIVAPGEYWDKQVLREYLVSPESSKRTQIAAKKIAKAFGLDDVAIAAGFDPTDFIGKQCAVTLKKDKGLDGGEQRRIKDFVAA